MSRDYFLQSIIPLIKNLVNFKAELNVTHQLMHFQYTNILV